MKRTHISIPIAMAFVIYAFIACTKNNADQYIDTSSSTQLIEQETFAGPVNIDSILKMETIAAIPFPQSGSFNCQIGQLYHDSILYDQKGSSSSFVVKVNKNPGVGKYYSWPQGLAIDSVTGSINVTASTGGYRYIVGFVKSGSRDTCLQQILIAGATYKDGVYVLGNNDTLIYPYFNANPAGTAICDNSGDGDYQDNQGNGNGNHRCEFDAEDHQGKKGRANIKHVKVRTISGAINLRKTLEEGAFGTTTPANGQGIMVPVYYKLQDKGNKALQKVNVQLIYYNSQTEIPATLLSYIDRRKTRTESRALIAPDGNPRPPLIVITRS
ncbi:MAG: hypothetical protein EOO00_02295 [Chitinophagaceae bacterium]|nr:MAG: hypothetical protein EOO00_02295 [Chitinophagaceae bacterium]